MSMLKEKPQSLRDQLEDDYGLVLGEPQFTEADLPTFEIGGIIDEDILDNITDVRTELLKRIIIQDNFGDKHDERRTWRDALPEDIQTYYKNHSKLRVNHINNISCAIFIIERSTNTDKELFGKIQQHNKDHFTSINTFNHKTIEEKVSIVETFYSLAAEYLKRLSLQIETQQDVSSTISES